MCARSILTAAICLMAASAAAQSPNAQPHCTPVGGTVMTNLILPDQDSALFRTLGTATGDLRGAVGAVLRNQVTVGDLTVFTVKHHWTTEAGDSLEIDEAQATAKELAANSNVFGIVEYQLKIRNGTGKFAGASGTLFNIGAVDLNTGRTVFRYSGQVCSAAPLR